MLLTSFGINTFLGLSIISLIMGIALYPIYPLGLHLPSEFSDIGAEYAGVGSGKHLPSDRTDQLPWLKTPEKLWN